MDLNVPFVDFVSLLTPVYLKIYGYTPTLISVKSPDMAPETVDWGIQIWSKRGQSGNPEVTLSCSGKTLGEAMASVLAKMVMQCETTVSQKKASLEEAVSTRDEMREVCSACVMADAPNLESAG